MLNLFYQSYSSFAHVSNLSLYKNKKPSSPLSSNKENSGCECSGGEATAVLEVGPLGVLFPEGTNQSDLARHSLFC